MFLFSVVFRQYFHLSFAESAGQLLEYASKIQPFAFQGSSKRNMRTQLKAHLLFCEYYEFSLFPLSKQCFVSPSTLHWRRGWLALPVQFQGLCDNCVVASILPNFNPFDIHADGAVAQRWQKWIKRLQNLFVAGNIKDKKRQRALLLYYVGEQVCEIFETFPESGDDFDKAKEKLDAYFDPKKNIEYEIYTFRQAKENSGESMNSYHSRLRQLTSTCEFADTDKEINSQIILSCSSQHLRRKALKDTTMTLQALLDEARALEVSEKQAVDKESSGSTNAVLPQKSKMPEKKSIWFNCGESWRHDSGGCPARNHKCNSCQRYGHYATCCRNGRRSSNPV